MGATCLAVLLLAGGVALGTYALGRGSGADLEAAREAGARGGQQEGTQQGGARGYEAGFEEGLREARSAGQRSADDTEAGPADEEAAGDGGTGGTDLEGLAGEEIAQDGLTIDPGQIFVEESAVDQDWAVVSGFAVEGESWAVWFQNGEAVAEGSTDADRPADAPCDLAPFSEDRC
jgi:hypothetical protein